jgi:hypothetical protein
VVDKAVLTKSCFWCESAQHVRWMQPGAAYALFSSPSCTRLKMQGAVDLSFRQQIFCNEQC